MTSFFTAPGLHWSRFGVFRLNPLLPVTDPKFERKYCEQSLPPKEHRFSSMSMEFSSILTLCNRSPEHQVSIDPNQTSNISKLKQPSTRNV